MCWHTGATRFHSGWRCSPEPRISASFSVWPLFPSERDERRWLQPNLLPPLPHRSTQIKTYSWDNAQVLLVGNKCDMEEERVVSAERGRQLSEHLGEWLWNGADAQGAASQDCVWNRHASLVVIFPPAAPCFHLISCIVILPLSRLRVLWGQCQRQHQRKADLRAPGRYHLREDVWELGCSRSSHHRGQTGAAAYRAACCLSPRLRLLDTLLAPPSLPPPVSVPRLDHQRREGARGGPCRFPSQSYSVFWLKPHSLRLEDRRRVLMLVDSSFRGFTQNPQKPFCSLAFTRWNVSSCRPFY